MFISVALALETGPSSVYNVHQCGSCFRGRSFKSIQCSLVWLLLQRQVLQEYTMFISVALALETCPSRVYNVHQCGSCFRDMSFKSIQCSLVWLLLQRHVLQEYTMFISVALALEAGSSRVYNVHQCGSCFRDMSFKSIQCSLVWLLLQRHVLQEYTMFISVALALETGSSRVYNVHQCGSCFRDRFFKSIQCSLVWLLLQRQILQEYTMFISVALALEADPSRVYNVYQCGSCFRDRSFKSIQCSLVWLLLQRQVLQEYTMFISVALALEAGSSRVYNVHQCGSCFRDRSFKSIQCSLVWLLLQRQVLQEYTMFISVALALETGSSRVYNVHQCGSCFRGRFFKSIQCSLVWLLLQRQVLQEYTMFISVALALEAGSSRVYNVHQCGSCFRDRSFKSIQCSLVWLLLQRQVLQEYTMFISVALALETGSSRVYNVHQCGSCFRDRFFKSIQCSLVWLLLQRQVLQEYTMFISVALALEAGPSRVYNVHQCGSCFRDRSFKCIQCSLVWLLLQRQVLQVYTMFISVALALETGPSSVYNVYQCGSCFRDRSFKSIQCSLVWLLLQRQVLQEYTMFISVALALEAGPSSVYNVHQCGSCFRDRSFKSIQCSLVWLLLQRQVLQVYTMFISVALALETGPSRVYNVHQCGSCFRDMSFKSIQCSLVWLLLQRQVLQVYTMFISVALALETGSSQVYVNQILLCQSDKQGCDSNSWVREGGAVIK